MTKNFTPIVAEDYGREFDEIGNMLYHVQEFRKAEKEQARANITSIVGVLLIVIGAMGPVVVFRHKFLGQQ